MMNRLYYYQIKNLQNQLIFLLKNQELRIIGLENNKEKKIKKKIKKIVNSDKMSFELVSSQNSCEYNNDNSYYDSNSNYLSISPQTNKIFKNVYKNSVMILKESFDYLNSKNKSI